MKTPLRYLVYLIIGWAIFELIESGAVPFSYKEARSTLIIAILVVFILLLIVRVIKQRLR